MEISSKKSNEAFRITFFVWTLIYAFSLLCFGTNPIFGQSPGGVSTDLELWLEANAGTATTTDNTANATWNDQSGNSNHAAPAGSNDDPTYRAVGNNYNPYLQFDGSNDSYDAGRPLGGVSEFTLIAVFNTTNSDNGGIRHWQIANCIVSTENRFVDYGLGVNNGILAAGSRESSVTDLNDVDTDVDNGNDHIAVFTRDALGSGNGMDLELFLDGNSEGTDFNNGGSADGDPVTNSQSITIGGNTGDYSALYYDGNISEVIAYSDTLTQSERERVQSYLAIKYGIAIGHDYVNSSGTEIYDVATFNNDIIGIGRDDTGGQLQKQSHQRDDSTRVYVGTLAASNSANAGTLTNTNQHIVLGHNNGVLRDAGSSEYPGTLNIQGRISREWKVTNTNFSDNFTLDVTLDAVPSYSAGTEFQLLVDTDSDFSSGATLFVPTVTQSGNTLTLSGISNTAIPSGATRYITIVGVLDPSPGGILSNLQLWLKADAGTGTTTDNTANATWADQSEQNNDAAPAGSNDNPTYRAVGNNYNPYLRFDGSNDSYDAGRPLGGASEFTIAAVFNTTNSDNGGVRHWQIANCIVSTENRLVDYGLGVNNGILAAGSRESSVTDLNDVDTEVNDGDDHIAIFTRDALGSGNGMNLAIYLDGTSEGTDFNNGGSADGDPITNSQTITIGGNTGDYSALYYDGNISEVIAYSGILTQSERERLQSYLAIKYSIPIGHDYVHSSGTEIYDIATFNNDIIGIGRDDNSGLLQKQSHQRNDSTRIYLSSLVSTNGANSGTFSADQKFVIMGHDNQPLEAQATSEYPSGQGIFSRLGREWKVTNTGFDGTFSIDVTIASTSSITASHVIMLIDTDSDLSNATVVTPTVSVDGATITLSGLSTAQFPSNSTRYMTIASTNSATPLPIELLRFDAVKTLEQQVELNWETASEINNDYFTIERAKTIGDWEAIHQEPGAGTSSVKQFYQAFDVAPLAGVSYYRLKQTDYDGRYTYAPIRLVDFSELAESDSRLKIYPNPTENVLMLKGNLETLKNIRILNVFGQELTPYITMQFSQTKEELELDLTFLASGIYYINTPISSTRVVKL